MRPVVTLATPMSRQPSFRTRESGSQTALILAACIVAIAGFRVVRAAFLPELPNFSPVTAMAFCGGLLLPGMVAWILPMAVLVVSDIALSAVMGYPVFSSGQAVAWLATLAVIAAGRWMASRGEFRLTGFFGSLLGVSVMFYLLTNAFSWLANPAYPRSLDGLWMSLTVGLPGFPPTWTFFRNSLFSDVLFAAVMLAVYAVSVRTERRHTLAAAA